MSPKMSVPGIAPNGKPRPWLDRVWPGKSKNLIFGQKTLVFELFLAISHYLGVSPGGASTVFYLSGPCNVGLPPISLGSRGGSGHGMG